MIENLNGIFETVNFKKLPSIKVYHNNKFENYPLHWHTPIEIIMPINNWYDITCGDKTFRLEEYDIALIISGTLHKLTAPERGKRLIFQIDCSVFHAMKEPNTILSFLAPLTIITKKTYPTIHTQIIQILMSIHDEYFSNGTFTETFIYFKILEILVLLGKNYTESNTHFDVGISKQQEYAEKFSVHGENMECHPRRFCRQTDPPSRRGRFHNHFPQPRHLLCGRHTGHRPHGRRETPDSGTQHGRQGRWTDTRSAFCGCIGQRPQLIEPLCHLRPANQLLQCPLSLSVRTIERNRYRDRTGLYHSGLQHEPHPPKRRNP